MNMSRNMSLILGGCTSLAYLVGSFIPLFLVDRFGRRILLMLSGAGLCLCFVLVAILLSLGSIQAAYGATAFIFLFQIFYGLGWLPVPWFYPSEISTTRLRTKSAAIASAFNWLSVFAVVKITPIAIRKILAVFFSLSWTSTDDARKHQLASVYHLRGTQLPLGPDCLLLLPRDTEHRAGRHQPPFRTRWLHRGRVLDQRPDSPAASTCRRGESGGQTGNMYD